MGRNLIGGGVRVEAKRAFLPSVASCSMSNSLPFAFSESREAEKKARDEEGMYTGGHRERGTRRGRKRLDRTSEFFRMSLERIYCTALKNGLFCVLGVKVPISPTGYGRRGGEEEDGEEEDEKKERG